MVAGTCGGNGFQTKMRAFIPLSGLGIKEKRKQKYLGTSFAKIKNSRTFVIEESFDIMQTAEVQNILYITICNLLRGTLGQKRFYSIYH